MFQFHVFIIQTVTKHILHQLVSKVFKLNKVISDEAEAFAAMALDRLTILSDSLQFQERQWRVM